MTPLNKAQKLLQSIGGTAELVAGVGDHWWADPETQKKPKRPGAGKHQYSKNPQEHFDTTRTKRNTK